MSGYTSFAPFYDGFMGGVDYPARACYLLKIFERHLGKFPESLIDLGCGTGVLTGLLASRGIDMIGVDASAEMLLQAKEQNAGYPDILWVCQPLQELDLYGTSTGAVATLDTVNHLCDLADLQAFFGRVKFFIEPGGLLVFDANTVYKHREILGNNNFVYETPGVVCVWQNTYFEGSRKTRMDLDFFAKNSNGSYTRTGEHFYERAHWKDEYILLAQENGFSFVAEYDDNTFEPLKEDSQRAVYVFKRNDNNE